MSIILIESKKLFRINPEEVAWRNPVKKNLQPNFQKGGDLTGPQLLERVAGEEGDDFSGGWVGRLQFSHKN